MRPRLKVLLLAAAALHLFLICQKSLRAYPPFSSLHAQLPQLAVAGEYYTQLTVMQADYSFFSPDIAPDFYLAISLQRPDGRWVATPMPVPNAEVQKRLHSCLLGIQRLPTDLEQIIVKSWAARVLDTHPEARLIRVTVSQQKQPHLAAYAQGQRMHPEVVLDVLFDTHTAPR